MTINPLQYTPEVLQFIPPVHADSRDQNMGLTAEYPTGGSNLPSKIGTCRNCEAKAKPLERVNGQWLCEPCAQDAEAFLSQPSEVR